MTTKSTRSITSRRMSARVMYRLSTVSYNRLFGYFLIVRGSLMEGPSLWVVVAPSLVPGRLDIPYYIGTANRNGKPWGFPLRHGSPPERAPAARHGTGPDPNGRRPTRARFGVTRA